MLVFLFLLLLFCIHSPFIGALLTPLPAIYNGTHFYVSSNGKDPPLPTNLIDINKSASNNVNIESSVKSKSCADPLNPCLTLNRALLEVMPFDIIHIRGRINMGTKGPFISVNIAIIGDQDNLSQSDTDDICNSHTSILDGGISQTRNNLYVTSAGSYLSGFTLASSTGTTLVYDFESPSNGHFVHNMCIINNTYGIGAVGTQALHIEKSIFKYNRQGALHVSRSILYLSNSIFDGNNQYPIGQPTCGTAISSIRSNVFMSNTLFMNHQDPSVYGGVDCAIFYFSGSGGIIQGEKAFLSIQGSQFINNTLLPHIRVFGPATQINWNEITLEPKDITLQTYTNGTVFIQLTNQINGSIYNSKYIQPVAPNNLSGLYDYLDDGNKISLFGISEGINISLINNQNFDNPKDFLSRSFAFTFDCQNNTSSMNSESMNIGDNDDSSNIISLTNTPIRKIVKCDPSCQISVDETTTQC